LLAKLLAPFKNEKTKVEKKAKAPKSPKKEKKKEEVEVGFFFPSVYKSNHFS
jgi:hypothetical protein